jgi:hypothetical protein
MPDEGFLELIVRFAVHDYTRLNKTRSRGALIAVTGFLMCLGAAIAQNAYREFSMALGFIGFALFGGSIIYVIFTGRCVHCQQRIGILLHANEDELLVPREMRFCPYCGKSLDDDATT